jgi:hypothetical protein
MGSNFIGRLNVADQNTTKMTRENTDTVTRVAFELSPAMAEELDRIMDLTDLSTKPEVFRRAFTLLRIHVDAATKGREIYMVDPERPNEKYFISLPFQVRRE